jgi:hypothetical protein
MCNGVQGAVVGLPNFNMGQWNAMQQMQALNALQTLTSLEVCNMGQQGSLLNSTSVNIEQHGQGALCSNVSRLVGIVGTQATV